MAKVELPPHNREAEEALLGALFIDPGAVVKVAAVIKPDQFYIAKNGWVYEAILALHRREEQIDYLTVCDELEHAGRLDELGGPAYVSGLVDTVPTALHAETYGRIIREAAMRREIIRLSSDAAKLAWNDETPVDETLGELETRFYQLRADLTGPGRLRHIKDIAGQVWDDLAAAMNGERKPSFPTGYADLTQKLGGFRRGTLAILGSRPGVGKTALMLNLASQAAANTLNVLFFSLEMTSEGLIHRLIASGSEISLTRLGTAQLTEKERTALPGTLETLSKKTIWVDDTPSIALPEMRAQTMRLAARHPLALIMVDYVQLAQAGRRYDRRYLEVGEIAKGLKALAKETDTAVILASQVSRAVEQREDKRPTLADLRESGDLEQHADVVMFISRDMEEQGYQVARLDVAKNRYGPTGVIDLQWQPPRVRFVALAKSEVLP